MSRTGTTSLFLLFRATLTLLLLGGPQIDETLADSEDPLKVAAAADLEPVMEPLLQVFTRKTGTPVSVVYGASGELALQVRQGAAFDLFLSADERFPLLLVRKGLADPSTLRTYARGKLILWISGEKRKIMAGAIERLKDPSFGKIAVANPRIAPYGRAAFACLRKMNLLGTLRKKLVFGNSVAQVAQFIRTGAVKAGFLSEAQGKVLGQHLSGKGLSLSPPCSPFLLQKMVVLRRTHHPIKAREFESFLLGKDARKIFSAGGYR